MNLAIADDDGLIVTRRGAGSVDNTHMGQCDYRRFYTNELLALRGRRLGQAIVENAEQQKKDGCDFHGFSKVTGAKLLGRALPLLSRSDAVEAANQAQRWGGKADPNMIHEITRNEVTRNEMTRNEITRNNTNNTSCW
ncbi:MAG: hypothetical protein ACREXY_17300, partial [Gammaproteobacteria bacterium]